MNELNPDSSQLCPAWFTPTRADGPAWWEQLNYELPVASLHKLKARWWRKPSHVNYFFFFTVLTNNKTFVFPARQTWPNRWHGDVRHAPYRCSWVQTCRVEKEKKKKKPQTEHSRWSFAWFTSAPLQRTWEESGRLMQSWEFWNKLASNRREGDSQTTLMRGHSKQTSSIAQITFGARQKKKKTIEMSGGKKKWQVLKLCFPRTCCHSCRSPGISQPSCDSFVIVQTQSEFLIPRWHLSQYLISPEMMNNCSSGCVQGICVAFSCSLRFRPRISKKKNHKERLTPARFTISQRGPSTWLLSTWNQRPSSTQTSALLVAHREMAHKGRLIFLESKSKPKLF